MSIRLVTENGKVVDSEVVDSEVVDSEIGQGTVEAWKTVYMNEVRRSQVNRE